MPDEIKKTYELSPQETALLCGDFSKLSEAQRAELVMRVCDSVGLNPLTRPFQYIELNKKLTLYATKDCTEQLRKIHDVSLTISSREQIGDAYVVTACAKMPSGRVDESTGAVATKGLGGDNLANAMMKTETKAKRRVTLSICGLGLLDESEIDTIAGAKILPPVSLPAQTQALPAATVAPTVQAMSGALAAAEMDRVRTIGKQLGKLAGAVNNDLQRVGGDVHALKAEYEKALAEKNPRGAERPATNVPATSSNAAVVAPDEASMNNAPAVDGEAGTATQGGTEESFEAICDEAQAKSEAPESEKTAAVMKVMTHAGFEREYPKYEDKMKVCSEVLGRPIAAWSALEPSDCAKMLEFLKSTEQAQGELMATEAEILQLQIELKDAKVIELLKTGKSYKASQEAGKDQAYSLRDARLALSSLLLGKTMSSYKELTNEEVRYLFGFFNDQKKCANINDSYALIKKYKRAQ